jgi:hypothetical protein
MYKKRENKAKKQKFGRRRDTIHGPLDQKSDALPTEEWRLATSSWQNNIYIAIVITTVENRTIGKSVIFRHDKHLNFYRSVNIWKLILENFLNYKITETWQKPRTCWIRKLHHFKIKISCLSGPGNHVRSLRRSFRHVCLITVCLWI